MNPIPQTASMYDLKNKTNEVFAKTADGPVLLMNRATPKAVIVSPEAWDDTARRMSELEFEIEALRARLDDNEDNWYSVEDMQAGLRKRGILADAA